MYERPRVKVKVETRSTFTLTLDRPYMASFIYMRKIYMRTSVKITRQS